MTRTNGVTIWELSRQHARRNCSTGEDAGYPRQDGKTPWSFTVAWYWILVYNVQNRWETMKRGRQFSWSHLWDTTLCIPEF